MKAIAVYPTRHELKLIEVPVPLITRSTEVKLRMIEVGVCGTDREICAFEYGTPPPGEQHLVIGHEALAEVTEVGAEVTRVKVGDLVVPIVRRACPHAHCAACRAGRQDFCFTGDFTERGIKGVHGFMTEYVVEDERLLMKVPGALREVAVLVEPLTIASKALIQVFDLQQRLPWSCAIRGGGDWPCRHAVVLGAGPVGLLGAMSLLNAGFVTYVLSREQAPNQKATLVESIGATYLSAADLSPRDVAEKVGNIDIVYEATGASQASFELMQHLGTNGVFVLTGVPGKRGPVEIDTDGLMRSLVLKNQVILGTVNAGQDAYEGAIKDLAAFMEKWPKAVRSLITGKFAPEAHLELLVGKAQGIKNVVRFDARA